MNYLRNELKNLVAESSSEAGKEQKLVTFSATVISGFENQAVDEIKQKLKPTFVFRVRGHVFFNAPAKDYEEKVLKLRSVDNLYMVLHQFGTVKFDGKDKAKDLALIKSFAEEADWKDKLPLWASLVHYDGILFPDKPSSPVAPAVLDGSCPPLDTVSETASDTAALVTCASDEGTAVIAVAPTTPISESTTTTDSGIEEPNVILPDVVLIKERGIDSRQEIDDVDGIGDGETAEKLNESVDNGSSEDFLSCSSGEENGGDDEKTINRVEKLVDDESEKTDQICDTCVELKTEKDARLETNEIFKTVVLGQESSVAVLPEESVCETESSIKAVSVPATHELPVVLSQPAAETPVCVTEAMQELPLSTTDLQAVSVTDPNVEDESQEENASEIEEDSTAAPEEIAVVPDVPEEAAQVLVTSTNDDKGRRKPRRGRNQSRKKSTRVLKPYVNDGILKFRATCFRTGPKHSFSSMEAAWDFGGTLNDKFFWTVDLTRFDLNAVLVIEQDFVYVAAALTGESLHRRNITHFGPTTLRATVCYHLLHMAEPVVGEIIMDPMCGGASISIEGAEAFPKTYHVCGDHHDRAINRLEANLKSFADRGVNLKVDGFAWDTCYLPFKDNSIDVVVTDLPYGIRVGMRKDNTSFYTRTLKEIARVVRGGLGRAVLMTADESAFTKALRGNEGFWKLIRSTKISHGGLRAVAFLLLRKKY